MNTLYLLGDIREFIVKPWVWSVLLLAAALWLLPPYSSPRLRRCGIALAIASAAALTASWCQFDLPQDRLVGAVVFWALAMLTLGAAIGTIACRSPVYSAISFSASIFGVGGLMLFQGAQFVAVSTVVVYAGAIVVTFLFVLMLAQSEGRSYYDRTSWGWYVKPASSVVAGALLGTVVYFVTQMQSAHMPLETTAFELHSGVMTESHTAGLGAELFTRYLIPIEIAGTLLMIALVGAVMMMSRKVNDPEKRVEHD